MFPVRPLFVEEQFLGDVDAREEATRDDEPLNLRRSLEDVENLGVTEPFVEELSRL